MQCISLLRCVAIKFRESNRYRLAHYPSQFYVPIVKTLLLAIFLNDTHTHTHTQLFHLKIIVVCHMMKITCVAAAPDVYDMLIPLQFSVVL